MNELLLKRFFSFFLFFFLCYFHSVVISFVIFFFLLFSKFILFFFNYRKYIYTRCDTENYKITVILKSRELCKFDFRIFFCYAATHQRSAINRFFATHKYSSYSLLSMNDLTTWIHLYSVQHWFISTVCNEYEYNDDIKLITFKICLLPMPTHSSS